MNFKQQFSEILNALGFTDSAKKKNITGAQWVEIESSFKEKYIGLRLSARHMKPLLVRFQHTALIMWISV